MTPFEPIGDQARWRVLYDLLRKLDVNDTLSYDEMGEALDLDPSEDRARIQMAFRRAAKEYEEVDQRAVDVVTNVGYRVVEPPEHLRLARRHQKRSRKELTKGQSKVVHVDLTGMDAETRKAFMVVGQAFAMQQDMMRRMDVRQSRLEEAVASTAERQERSDEELAELRARLERLEQGHDQPAE